MGKIITTIEVVNHEDETAVKLGVINENEVRKLVITNVLVDTGATTLCLPKNLIQQLGLPIARNVPVETAMGDSFMNIYQDVKLQIMGREGIFECVELPDGRQPLLGVLPMEGLGIEPNLNKQILELLPTTGPKAYITV